ncbi:MAG TPA: hypothetical protein VHL59_07765, partial [Thermoanaerobaculia bacterium]|nr:hypothetical protein [Thermoanaerobaculia bacterium]
MLAELVLVTRILGLVSGEQPINVQVDRTVAAVEIVLDGKQVATLRQPPWRTLVDFGDELMPHELIAIAYDAQGNELARDRQLVNLARPPAEAAIDLKRDPDGTLRATVRWQHIGYEKPKQIAIALDGKPIGSSASVALPPLEQGRIHLLEAELTFSGNIVARKELVFGGIYAEEVPSELTGVLVQQNEIGRTDAANCFRLDGRTVAAAAVEKPLAQVLFVRSSDPELARSRLHLPIATNRMSAMKTARLYALEGARMRFIWPTAREARSDEAESVSNLFLRSELMVGGIAGGAAIGAGIGAFFGGVGAVP